MQYDKESIEKEKNLFKNIIQRNSSVMLLIDPDTGKILDANKAAENYYGFENLTSLNITDINNLNHEKTKSRLKAALNEEKKYFEFKHQLSSGELRDVEVYATPISYQNRTLIFSIIHDITAKKQAEQNSNILSDETFNLIGLKTPHEIYSYTVEKLYSLLRESVIITIAEYDNPNNRWQMKQVKGINPLLDKTLKQLGIDVHQMEGEIKTEYLSQLKSSKLTALDFDLPGLTNEKYSEKIANAVRKVLPVKQMLAMPFKKSGIIYGNVTVLTTAKTVAFDKHLIEAFISQAAMFLEKIHIENDLRENQQKLKEAEKIAKIGNFEFDLKKQRAHWSEEALHIFGLDYNRFNQANYNELIELIHPDERENVIRHFNESVAEGKTMDVDYRIIRKDDSLRYIHSLGKITEDEKGAPEKMFGIVQDVTAQKETEKELFKNEAKYRAIFENSYDSVAVHPITEDAFNGFPEVNSQTVQTFGYSREELKSLNIFDIVPEEEHPRIQNALEKIFTKGKHKLETRHITKSGKVIPVEVKGYVFDVGLQKYLTVVTRSLEKQKKAEQDLIDSRNYYQALIEKSTDVVSILDEKGRIQYESPSHKHILGYDTGELIGANGFSLIHPQDMDSVGKQFSKLAQKPEKTESFSFRFRHKDGSWRFLEGTGKNLLNNPSVQGIVVNYRDATKRIEFEQQLIEAKEKAEESERLKTAFLANMSHEIRTPMNGILGFIDILREPEIPEDEKETYLDLVKKSGERLLTTINDIIEISKIEANQTYLNFSDEDLDEIMNEHLAFFKPEAESKNIALKIAENSEHERVIRTDKNKLDSIFTNLIKNAIKFTSDGTIEFGCVQKNSQLEFYVKDTGIGVAPERIKAIFNRFEQAETGISRGHEGTGLGLSISKAYAKMLGGNLWVKSEKGKGSTFFFTINLTPVEQEETPAPPKEETFDKSNYAAKILVVEDDKISYSLVKSFLARENFQLLYAKNGQIAIELVEEHTDIDLILMDMKMPVMDGYTATREIRKLNKDIPIIAQTAYALEGDREKALAAGCDDYVSKPLKKNDLIRKINESLKQ